jgi:hypothetical protein
MVQEMTLWLAWVMHDESYASHMPDMIGMLCACYARLVPGHIATGHIATGQNATMGREGAA